MSEFSIHKWVILFIKKKKVYEDYEGNLLKHDRNNSLKNPKTERKEQSEQKNLTPLIQRAL